MIHEGQKNKGTDYMPLSWEIYNVILHSEYETEMPQRIS